jgi:hypothetical protein
MSSNRESRVCCCCYYVGTKLHCTAAAITLLPHRIHSHRSSPPNFEGLGRLYGHKRARNNCLAYVTRASLLNITRVRLMHDKQHVTCSYHYLFATLLCSTLQTPMHLLHCDTLFQTAQTNKEK